MNKQDLSNNQVPTLQKIIFGLGMLGNQMFPAALGIFMVVLVEGLGLNPILWGVLFFLPRMLDAVTDPIMGYISDNTHSKWGRRRPYIFIGAVVSGLSFIGMWQLYPENGELYNFYYFLGFSLIFYLGLTVFSTPFVAMGYEMSPDYHERTKLMAVAQWIGQWAWVIVPWFWVIIYDQSLFENSTSGARELAIYVGIFCLILCLMPAIFGKTQIEPSNIEKISGKRIGENVKKIFVGLIETFHHKPFRKLCIATFFIFNAFNTVAAFSFFIIVYYMFNGDTGAAGTWPAWFGTLSALSTCFFVIPIITFLSKRVGKKNTFLISQVISLLGYSMFYWAFQPQNPYYMFIPLPFFAFGIGGLFTLMMSMTADVCDLDDLKYGKRREGTFGAVYWWMVKVGFAVAGLLSGIILSSVGFDQSVAQQTPEALNGLLTMYIVVPIFGTLVAIWVMSDYDLDEKKAKEIRLELSNNKLNEGKK